MKIENRARLLKALENSSSAVKRNQTDIKSDIAQGRPEESSGAVKVATGFGSNKSEADRSARVQELKAQINAGEYKQDSNSISRSMIEELGVIRG